jgi:hypothetical protein
MQLHSREMNDMNTITEYKFLVGITPAGLNALVNAHIQEGWQPVGTAVMSKALNTSINPDTTIPAFEVNCIGQPVVRYASE